MNQYDGCWECEIDPRWHVAVNGHKDAREATDTTSVPPFSAYVKFNGWPAGIIDPFGGCMAQGAIANEDTFIEAVEAAIRDLHGLDELSETP